MDIARNQRVGVGKIIVKRKNADTPSAESADSAEAGVIVGSQKNYRCFMQKKGPPSVSLRRL
jgi:hypothetical protein